MSNAIVTQPQTSIAAVCWAGSDEKTCVRVYTQDISGGIRESAYDGATWTFNKDPIAKAKPASALAAFKHYEDIHVYYLSSDNIIQEISRDWRKPLAGNWAKGPLSGCNIKAHPLSRLAALGYTKDIDCTVFYQNPAGLIGHLRRVDSGGVTWKAQEPFGKNAITGTGLAAVSPDPYGSAQIRVYFQEAHTSLSDIGVQDSGSYQPGILEGKARTALTNTHLSAVSNELYYLGLTNWLSEGGYYSSDWHFENHPGHIRVHPGSGVAVTLDSSGQHRAYVQDDTNQILEVRYTRTWENMGATAIPTVAQPLTGFPWFVWYCSQFIGGL